MEANISNQILFITYEYGNKIDGGIGRVINGMTECLKSQINFDVFLLQYLNEKRTWEVNFYKIKKNRCRKKNYKIPFTFVFRQLIEKKNYRIIHLMHHGVEIIPLVNIIKKYIPQAKIIYSCHSMGKIDLNIRSITPAIIKVEEEIMKKTDFLHVLNQTCLKYLEQYYAEIIKNKKVYIIPNGVNEMDFRQKSLLMPTYRIRKLKKRGYVFILCISRWTEGKGLEYLIDSVPEVVRQCKRVKFIIAGKRQISWENDFKKYPDKIEKKIAMTPDDFIVLNWLNDKERNTLFSLADIWVMPSLLEYFPYSILEPMMAKLPIISSRIAAVTEILKEDSECLYFEPGNHHELAEKLIYLIKNKKIQDQLKKNAFQKAVSLYQWKSIANNYLQMYDNCYCYNKENNNGT